MQYSKLFTRTKKQAPKDELTDNAKLLVRAGFVNKLMAGAYSYLPLGLRVLNKIENIIREEMNNIGGQEVLLPALHPAEIWKQTNGWNTIDILFKIKSRTEKDYALGQSHEEVITPLIKGYVNSYKDLPIFVYQIQNKYRDELRAKSGLLRGRDFGMKDMYSFNLDQKDFDRHYEIIKKSYLTIFKRCGLTAKVTEASGGAFSQKISYEFMVLTSAGEDEILYCKHCDYCINLSIAKVKKRDVCPKCNQGRLDQAQASEAGNVFDLGQKYTKAFNFYVLDNKGKKVYPIMGCYGIGTTRLMGIIVEKYHDDKGIIWPKTVAPYLAYLISTDSKHQEAYNFYQRLIKEGIEVFWDDRKEVSLGNKFADADLIGLPVRLVISNKTNTRVEWKDRRQEQLKVISHSAAIEQLKK